MRVLVAFDFDSRGGSALLAAAPARHSAPTGDYPQATFVAQLLAACLRRSRSYAEQHSAQDMARMRYDAAASIVQPERPALDRSI